MLLTYESAGYDTLLYRIEQVKKDYKAFASNKNYLRDFGLLDLLKLMADSRDVKHDAAVQKGIKSLLKYKTDTATGDSEIISYEGWLNKKLASANSLRA